MDRESKKIYFGGGFHILDNNDLESSMRGDYRSLLLGDVRRLLYSPKNSNKEIALSDYLIYVGPYYYYDGKINAHLVVSVENEMINKCTDAVFLLDTIDSPGTITELAYAALLGKTIHIFYVSHDKDKSSETEINSDLWYPIAFAQMVNRNVRSVECNSREDAISRILSFVESMS